MARMRHVISYDITNDKRRRKLVALMEKVAVRVQYSVFETYLSSKELRLILERSLEFVYPKEGDSLRAYRMCRNCWEHFQQVGGVAVEWNRDLFR